MRPSRFASVALALGVAFLGTDAAAAGAAGSTPAVSPVPLTIPAPTNLVFATDAASCDKVRTGLPPKAIDPCKDLVNRSNSGTFSWDWPGNSPHPVVYGFKLYRVDGGRHDLMLGPTNKSVEGNTLILFGSVVPWACYAVSAYNLTAESPLSPLLCLGQHLEPVAPPSASSALATAPLGMQAAGTPGPLPGSPSPSPTAALAAPLTVSIPPPANLVTTKDPRICAAHGGPSAQAACRAAVRRGGTALVWDYAPAHIDGFRLYAVTPAPLTSAATATVASSARSTRKGTPAGTQTALMENGVVSTFFLPDVLFAVTQCFAVAAYAGAQESDLSASVCMSGPQGPTNSSP
jgi:hypothetical protein